MESRRTALITGGTGSLGFHTAQAILARGGWEALITGRSGVAEAAERLGASASGRRLDLGSLDAVRSFVRDLPPLDAIVCNAGLLRVSGTRLTDDGIEETFAVNHLAHFLLVREALPLMRPGSRVVFVSGAAHDPARRTGFPPPDFGDASELARPDGERAERRMRAGRRRYAASKLCAVMTAYEFARRIPSRAVAFNAFDPGRMPGTGLARDFPKLFGSLWHRVMPALAAVPGAGRRGPERSAAALARLICDPQLAGVTGRYYRGEREIRSSAASYDAAKRADLWETSTALAVA
ncbi:MAG TPA: SDR family NAD(P)-dependent oxidoreductase [Glycomyces sp.]|nr:SDR family NAD(P)-dependent oxidoreductase [Glycomyces sp.]